MTLIISLAKGNSVRADVDGGQYICGDTPKTRLKTIDILLDQNRSAESSEYNKGSVESAASFCYRDDFVIGVEEHGGVLEEPSGEVVGCS